MRSQLAGKHATQADETEQAAVPGGHRSDAVVSPERLPAPQPRGLLTAERLLDGRGFNGLRLFVDVIMLILAVVAALLGATAADAPLDGRGFLYVYPVFVVLLLHLRGMYTTRLRILILDGIAPVVSSVTLAAMVCMALELFVDSTARPGPLMIRVWLFALAYVGAGRVLLAVSQRRARRRGVLYRPALIVGAGAIAAQVARRLEERPEYGLRPVGFLDADPLPEVQVADRRAPVLGNPGDLERVAGETGARHVILAFTNAPDSALVPLVRQCDELGLEVSVVPRMFESVNERVALDHLGGLPLHGLHTIDPKGWQFTVKHAIDRFAAALILLVLAPLLLILAVAVKATSRGPLLFRQRRVGRDGQIFDLMKLRSMRHDIPPEEGFVPAAGKGPGGVEGVERRTAVGRVIRRTSLDELPQLINVLRGEMSLVGPRPERPEFVSLFREDIDRYSDRHRVKSGITGWAQVHGYRGQTSLADRVEWDNFYIENWSLYLDLKILLLTVSAVFRNEAEA